MENNEHNFINGDKTSQGSISKFQQVLLKFSSNSEILTTVNKNRTF